MGISSILNLTGLPEKVLKETEKQGQAVVNEVVSELGGKEQKAEPPPVDAGDTKDFVRRMYAPQNPIDENSIRQVQRWEENTPFNIEVIRAKIAGREPPTAPSTKKQEIARLQSEYFNATFKAPPQQPKPPEQPKQPEPLKASHERTSNLSQQELVIPGQSKRKRPPSRMAAYRAARKAETGASQSSIG